MPTPVSVLRAAGITLLLPLLWVLPARAQLGDPIRLFGYFQNQFRYTEETGFSAPPKISSYSMQQLNVLMAKDFGPRFGAFVDVELTNSFSTQHQIGDFQVAEAWMRYERSPALKVKVGLHVPPFNNLNDIKNRTPLLPYVLRPLIYESSLRNVLDISDYAPHQAFAQVYGTVPLRAWQFDYAAYAGNQQAFITSDGIVGSIPAGTDLSPGMLLGTRVGVRRSSLKMGLSSTYEQVQDKNLQGDFPRLRLGADLSFFLRQLYFESEGVAVEYTLNTRQQRQLDERAAQSPLRGTSLSQRFFYVLLGYAPTEALMGYVSYSGATDHQLVGLGRLSVYSAGGVYRPVPTIALKAQVMTGQLSNDTFVDFSSLNLFAAASVMF